MTKNTVPVTRLAQSSNWLTLWKALAIAPVLSDISKPKTKKPKYVVKTAKNSFKNYYGTGKEKARDLIADAIKSTKRQRSNVLTLPADTWLMEKNILKQKPGYKFTAVERDKDTYKKMVKNLISNDELFDSVFNWWQV